MSRKFEYTGGKTGEFTQNTGKPKILKQPLSYFFCDLYFSHFRDFLSFANEALYFLKI